MHRSLALLLIPVVFLSGALPLAGQEFLPKSIQFKGDPEYSNQELLSAAGLKKGVVLSYAEMNAHSKQLMDSGVFDGLNFTFDGQDLIFQLRPAVDLLPIRLANLPLTPGKDLDAKLHDLLPLYHGKVPVEGGLEEGVRKALEEILAAQGLKATVSAAQFTDLKLHKVTAMSFAITAPPVVVGEIHFGGTAISSFEPNIQELLSKASGAPYDEEGSPNQIITNLDNFYRDKGYLEAEARAVPQVAVAATPDAIRVPFQVSVVPGTLYKLVGVQLAPGLLVTQAEFDRQSQIHPGDIADSVRVRENWHFLERQYHDRGYMTADVRPTPTFDRSQGTVSYFVTVQPGQVYTMGTLTIENVSDDLRTAMLAA